MEGVLYDGLDSLVAKGPMHIGIDARLVHYTQAGIGQYIIRLTQALAAINREDQFILLQHRADTVPLVHQPNFRRVGLWTPSHHRLEQWLLGLELPRRELDVLHSPDFIPPFHNGFRSVITIHDLAFLLYPHFLTRESARYYGQIDQAVQRADHIIAVSESTRRDTCRLLGVSEAKITVIYEAAHPGLRPIDREVALEHVRARFGISADYILFVSTIEPRKNVAGLLRAYRRLCDDYKVPHGLVLAGARGWLSDEVYALVDELNLSARCRFLGPVSSDDLVYLYNAATCLAHPAFYEGFGLPPLEAMACGTPVVVSNVGSLPEVVGDAALLVDPNDTEALAVALGQILTDADLRAMLRSKGLAQAARFSWRPAAEETLAVYRRVAEA